MDKCRCCNNEVIAKYRYCAECYEKIKAAIAKAEQHIRQENSP